MVLSLLNAAIAKRPVLREVRQELHYGTCSSERRVLSTRLIGRNGVVVQVFH